MVRGRGDSNYGIIMSADNLEASDICCASCGKAEVDDVKLKDVMIAIW